MKNLNPNEVKIQQEAVRTLNLNILELDTGNAVVYAGGNQFRTLWVRDFCYSVDGLLSMGQHRLVKFQLSLILSFLSKEGFLPRGLDVISPKWRVLQNTVLQWLPIFTNQYPTVESQFNRLIKPEYLGEHRTPAIDSNALFILAYNSYGQKTKDWFLPIEKIERLIKFYKQYVVNGLFDQPPYSDWQDSVLRRGPLALLQLQIVAAQEACANLNILTGDQVSGLQVLKKKILDTFFDSNTYLFYQDPQKTRLSLDSYGFVFRYDLFKDVIDLQKLYRSLKASLLWQHPGGPGVPVYPEYVEEDVSWTTKAVGLRHYHDGFHWGWLIAEAAFIAKINNDFEEYQKIVDRFSQSFSPEKNLAEIYFTKEERFVEFSGPLYRSENPFTWTAAKWLDAVNS